MVATRVASTVSNGSDDENKCEKSTLSRAGGHHDTRDERTIKASNRVFGIELEKRDAHVNRGCYDIRCFF